MKPVLSPEEWEDLAFSERDDAQHAVAVDCQSGLLSVTPVVVDRVGLGGRQRIDIERRAAMVALANHALPDGHPQKITHEDVDTIRAEGDDLASWAFDCETEEEMERQLDRGHALIRIADRLLALLPPKEGV